MGGVQVPPVRPAQSTRDPTGARRTRRAGWLARSSLTLLCLLWLIPTAGILVTSFRTSDAVNSSGWWTVLTSPLDTSQYTFTGYRQAWYGGMASSYLNSVAIVLPAVLIPCSSPASPRTPSPSCASAAG